VRVAFALLFLLTSCASADDDAVSRYEPEQLRTLTTTALCKPYLQGENVAAERWRRGLGDCSQLDQACASAVNRAGSPNYARCRANKTLQTNARCYFNGPATGRLGGSLSNTDLICSQRDARVRRQLK
jgi:hypothetical protein